MFLLFLFFSSAVALTCNIGDLNYLTTSENVSQKHRCTIDDFDLPLYIEFERYVGKTEDNNAVLTFEFIGSKTNKLSFGMNQVLTNGHLMVLPTQSSLENSLWLHIDENLSIMFRPRGYTHFLPLVQGNGDILDSIEISASTDTGMMQRIVQITNHLPPETISHSVEYLEQRVIDIEKVHANINAEIKQLKSENVHLKVQKDNLRTLTLQVQSSTRDIQVQYESMYMMTKACVFLTVAFITTLLVMLYIDKKKNKII